MNPTEKQKEKTEHTENMNISDEQKEHIELVVTNMKNINMHEYNRYNSIRKKEGVNKAYYYLMGNLEGKVDGFSHTKQQRVTHFSVIQKFPSRMDCPGSSMEYIKSTSQ